MSEDLSAQETLSNADSDHRSKILTFSVALLPPLQNPVSTPHVNLLWRVTGRLLVLRAYTRSPAGVGDWAGRGRSRHSPIPLSGVLLPTAQARDKGTPHLRRRNDMLNAVAGVM